MKMMKDIIITEFGDEFVMIPTEEAAVVFHGIIRLNITGKDIIQGLKDGLTEDEIAIRLVEKYEDVDFATAKNCTERIIEKLRTTGIVIE